MRGRIVHDRQAAVCGAGILRAGSKAIRRDVDCETDRPDAATGRERNGCDSQCQASRELAPAAEHIHALNIESLLAVPLLDAGEQSGILILEQTSPRQWRQTDLVVLKTIAEQVVLAVSNARLRTLMKTLAVTDEKSGLLKRSSYLDVLLSEVRRSLQQKTPLTLMLLHFGKASALVKEIGEAQVENMMQQIGQTLASHIRQNDVAVRYDLTTIALVLSDTTEKNAFLVVDKMRKVLARDKNSQQ